LAGRWLGLQKPSGNLLLFKGCATLRCFALGSGSRYTALTIRLTRLFKGSATLRCFALGSGSRYTALTIRLTRFLLFY